MKTLWIVSGGVEAVPGIRRAKEMGLYVVVSDMDPDAPGFEDADDRVIASTYDFPATVEAALRYHRTIRRIDGVMCIAADVPLTVASVADALGLPGISVETALLASDKLAMKERFVRCGIPVPWFSPVDTVEHLKEVVAQRGFPLVIKPVDSRGARGVLRLDPGIDLEWAWRHALGHSPGGRVMVEEYLDGQQVSTESVIIGETACTPGFGDRNYEYLDRFAPYIIENGGQQPTVLSGEDKDAISRLAEDAARAMGIERGVAKGDMVLTEEGPKVIEVAARLSGGWFSTDQIPLATGVDLVGAAIKLALGEDVTPQELLPRYTRGVAIRYFFPEPGRVVEIKNMERFADTPWVHRLVSFVRRGDVLGAVTNHTQRAGFVITVGDTRDEAVSRAVKVVDTVRIETVPVGGTEPI